ncbi:hypothetical protein V2G26_012559 [Clonostachys chloroleuca]
MPGVTRSKACQCCKRRKIKCDEKWPTCSPCKRTKLECPGPSTVVKFVHDAQAHSTSDSDQDSCSSEITAVGSNSVSLHMRKIVHRQGGSYSSFRIRSTAPRISTRPKLTTLSDRIAARLVSHLDRSQEYGITLRLGYLPFLPQRIPHSACLRDCVALFCAAWSNYRGRWQAGRVVTMSNYSKALRTLRNTLRGDQALSVETLAAMTLLERTEALFDWGQERCSAIHAHGIGHLITKKGYVDMNDELDVELAKENRGLLLGYWATECGKSFTGDARIIDVPEANIDGGEFWGTDELKPYLESALAITGGSYGSWTQWLQDAEGIQQDPFSSEMLDLAKCLRPQLSHAAAETKQCLESLMESTLDLGTLTKEDDPDSASGKSYGFKTAALAQLFNGLLMLRLVSLRISYDLSVIYGSPDTDLYSEYQEVCGNAWMCISYLRKLDVSVSAAFLGPYSACIEASSEKEMDSLQSIIKTMDSYLDRDLVGTGEPAHTALESESIYAFQSLGIE